MENIDVASAGISRRRLWDIVRLVFCMLQRGISKSKLLVELMKRSMVIGGKAIGNLMFHHYHHHHHRNASRSSSTSTTAPLDYEFSCSNTPSYHFPTTRGKRNHFFPTFVLPPASEDDDDHDDGYNYADSFSANLAYTDDGGCSPDHVLQSPMLPGLQSPTVRQLRVTDSPFPAQNGVEELGDHQIDEAAEEFIQRFYNQLKLQNKKD